MTSKEQVYRAALEKIAAHVIEPAGMARAALEEAARLAAETTTPLTECPYCKRPSDSEGGINHVGGCTALEDAGLNRLQLYMLLSRGAQKAAGCPVHGNKANFGCAECARLALDSPVKTPVTHEIKGNLFLRTKDKP